MLWGTLELIVWLLQKNLPAIVFVVVYAKEIMALSRGERRPRSPRSFLPLITNTKGDSFETPWPVISTFLCFHPYLSCPCVCCSLSSASVHVKRMLPRVFILLLRELTGGGLQSFCSWEHLLLSVRLRLFNEDDAPAHAGLSWPFIQFYLPWHSIHPRLPTQLLLRNSFVPTQRALMFHVI